MASAFLSSFSEVVLIDSRTRRGTITLPFTNAIPYRVLNFKDQYGSFSNSTLTLVTQSGESFEDGTTSKIFSNAYTYLTLYATSSKWMLLNATTTVSQTISSLTTSEINKQGSSGYIQIDPIQTSSLSSVLIQAHDGYFDTVFVGDKSTVNGIQFHGPFGNYNNTVIEEISTGCGSEELLFFKGSTILEKFRFQTTGSFVVETGVSARLWTDDTLSTPPQAIPSFMINVFSNVGIQVTNPTCALDVGGQVRAITVSTQRLYTSTINDEPFTTIRGTVVSTVAGLGSAGYISTPSLVSTTRGLQEYISSFIDPVELASSIIPFISSTYFTTQLRSTVRGLGSAGYVSSSTLSATFSSFSTAIGGAINSYFLNSTVIGLGSAGYVSTLSLVSTTRGLQQSGFISTPNLLNLVSTPNLLNLVSTPNLLNLVSTPNLLNLVSTPNLLNLVSTPNLLNLVSTPNLLNVVSTPNLLNLVSTPNLLDMISSPNLISTTAGLEFYISSFIDPVEIASSILPFISSSYFTTQLTSTVTGLGTSGYISTLSLVSTTQGLQDYISSFIDPTELASSITSTVFGLGLEPNLVSTVQGLGSSGYVSTLSLVSTTSNLIQGYGQAISTFSTLIYNLPGYQGALFYLNQTNNVPPYKQLSPYQTVSSLQSTTTTLPPNSDSNLLAAFQTDVPLPSFIPTGIWDLNLFTSATAAASVSFYYNLYLRAPDTTETYLFGSAPSPIDHIGIEQVTNSLNVTYTNIAPASTIVLKLFGSNYTGSSQDLVAYFQDNYYSHVHTSFNYGQEIGSQGVSSLSTVVGLQFYSTNLSLFSTVEGLGTSGYVSTLSMTSSIQQAISSLSTAYGTVGAGGLASIPSTLSTFAIFTSSIQASTATIQYISSLSLWVSSINGALPGSGGLATIPSTLSTFAILTSSLVTSTLQTLTLSSGSINVSTINTVSMNASTTGFISSLTVNSLQFGDGTGWVNIGPLQTVAISSIQENTNALYANNAYIGNLSTVNAIQFNGLFSNYNNTVLAETSTGAGIQELLIFKGSSTSDRVRVQTTGNFVVETGVSARLWSNTTLPTLSNATPAFIINTSSNVGIQTASPATTLDVAGTGRFQVVSTLALNISSINGQVYSAGGGGGVTSFPSSLSTVAFFTSSIFASTIESIYISSLLLVTSSLTTGFLGASTALISTMSTNNINFAGGIGFLTMPDIYPNTVYTSTVTTSNLLVGINSVVSPIQFFGFGSYSNSVIAELSTGATTQELLMFRGSNATDRIRFQTTGSLVFEPGVSARLWPTVPSNVTPAMVINTSSNVGIQTASPGATLDVAGTGRFQIVSTLSLRVSSINGALPGTGSASIPSTISTFAIYTSSIFASTMQTLNLSTSFMTGVSSKIDFYTLGVQRMTILSSGNVGIGTSSPLFMLDVAGTTRLSTLFLSSATAFNNISTVLLETSSLVGNNVQGNVLSSFAMGASTFTGKWNDAQYYVLQTI